MACIDKIYGTPIQWIELHSWIANSKRPQYCRWFYPTPNGEDGCIFNAPVRVDKWIFENCPLKWVRKRLIVMYGSEERVGRVE